MIIGIDASSAFALDRPSSTLTCKARGELFLVESAKLSESGSGERLVGDDDPSIRVSDVPKTAAAVEVAVSAALSVLNARGSPDRFLHAVWFSSLKGKFGAGGGGGGVRCREMHVLLPNVGASFERCAGDGLGELLFQGGDAERLLELDVGGKEDLLCVDELGAGAVCAVE